MAFSSSALSHHTSKTPTSDSFVDLTFGFDPGLFKSPPPTKFKSHLPWSFLSSASCLSRRRQGHVLMQALPLPRVEKIRRGRVAQKRGWMSRARWQLGSRALGEERVATRNEDFSVSWLLPGNRDEHNAPMSRGKCGVESMSLGNGFLQLASWLQPGDEAVLARPGQESAFGVEK
jgi:hypothetical protein